MAKDAILLCRPVAVGERSLLPAVDSREVHLTTYLHSSVTMRSPYIKLLYKNEEVRKVTSLVTLQKRLP
jgi:hypothetical protein